MIIDGLEFPIHKTNSTKVLLIGSLYVLFSFLIIPFFLLLGYFSHVIRFASKTTETLPDITQFRQLFIDGLKLFIVIMGYILLISIPSFILLSIGLYSQSSILIAIGVIISIMILSIGLICLLLGTIIFCKNEFNIKSAYDINKIKPLLLNTKVIFGISVVYFLYPIIQSAILGLLAVTTIGIILFPLIYFYFILSWGYILSISYNRSIEQTMGEGTNEKTS